MQLYDNFKDALFQASNVGQTFRVNRDYNVLTIVKLTGKVE